MPLAVRPRRIDCMSGRCQLASLIFCTVLKSPIARSEVASAATAKGTAGRARRSASPRPAGAAAIRVDPARCSANGTKPSSGADRVAAGEHDQHDIEPDGGGAPDEQADHRQQAGDAEHRARLPMLSPIASPAAETPVMQVEADQAERQPAHQHGEARDLGRQLRPQAMDQPRRSRSCTKPANIVMPATSGRPPCFAAATLTVKKTPEKAAGIRKPQPMSRPRRLSSRLPTPSREQRGRQDLPHGFVAGAGGLEHQQRKRRGHAWRAARAAPPRARAPAPAGVRRRPRSRRRASPAARCRRPGSLGGPLRR